MAQLDISNGVLDVTSTQGKTWGPIEVTVTDSAGAPVTPTAATWVIRDGYAGAAALSNTLQTGAAQNYAGGGSGGGQTDSGDTGAGSGGGGGGGFNSTAGATGTGGIVVIRYEIAP